jgi:hypothetical protein
VDVIVIAGSYPPRRLARSIQNARLVEALRWHGHLIVPRELRFDPSRNMDYAIPETMRVHRLWDIRGHRIHSALGRLGLRTGKSPDVMRFWAFQAGMLAAMLPRPDLIVTISHPLSTHLAGLFAKRTTRRSTPWMAYFADPWVDMEQLGYVSYSPRVRRRNVRLESQVVGRADALVFTNEETKNLFLDRYPRDGGKMHVVSQSFDPRLFPEPTNERRDATSPMVMRYIGEFYGPRTPRPLIEAALKLEAETGKSQPDWRIELYGRIACDDQTRCDELLARSRTVTAQGEVSYSRSLDLMIASDALLVIDAPAPKSPFLPSKLVDYLGARKPILGLTGDGAASALIRRTGGLVADVTRPDEIERALRTMIDYWRSGRLDSLKPSEDVRSQYALPNVAARFDAIARNLVGERPARGRRLADSTSQNGSLGSTGDRQSDRYAEPVETPVGARNEPQCQKLN